MSLLEISNLAGGYPRTRVLDGVDLTVERGGVLALLGRNGVGKTTLLHTVMGMLPGTGSIKFQGRDLLGLSTHQIARAGIALVPQGRRVFAPLTVDENLRISARGGNAAAWTPKRAYELFPGLAERRTNYAGQLSGGEQEMLSIARALVTNPDLLLMDEPSDGLAPAIIKTVGEAVTELARVGVTVLLVEQNLALALDVADEVAVMSKGRITFSGAPSELKGDSRRVRELLGVG
ncbi:ABC transporter ATP-binding protein [Nonomuraea sp. NPDC049400]|uniref:ABC transporter ATP-binding protein n=1 Tax=Nonomuraea sp. NPDC049400 TaxID=3364352 RepID=UPI003797FF2C